MSWSGLIFRVKGVSMAINAGNTKENSPLLWGLAWRNKDLSMKSKGRRQFKAVCGELK